MACTANKTHLLRTVVSRGYSAQVSPKASNVSTEIKSTVLPNKLIVASIDNNSPISRILIQFKAGSRYETYENLGTTHVLRVAASLSNKNSSAFGLMRNMQQIGGSITCTSDREVVAYTSEITRNKLDTGLKYLEDVALHHVFKPWELNEIVGQIKYDLARVPAHVRAVDLLHRAAFRSELGNSIFCAKHHVGKLSPETLQHYVNQNFGSNRTVVCGVGIDHQTLVGYAKNLHINSASGTVKDKPAVFNGLSEFRVDKSGNVANVAVATQGQKGFTDVNECIAFEVLKYITGAGPVTKRGNSNGIVGKAVTKAIGDDKSFEYTSLNAYYSDNGLFGFVLSADTNDIGKGIDAAIKSFKSLSISAEDLARGKQLVKANTLYILENDSEMIHELGLQATFIGNTMTICDWLCAIDAISAADVNAAAKKVASGKWSMGAVGNLKNVPFISQLN